MYNNRVSTEWDVALAISDQEHLHQLVSDAAETSQCNSNVVYMLIGGVERAERGSVHAKFSTGEHQYHDHVHAALVVKTPINRKQALDIFCWDKPKGAFCAPRPTKWPYLTWKYHHTKKESKLNDNVLLFEAGTLPLDNTQDPATIEHLFRYGKKFATLREWEHITQLVGAERARDKEQKIQLKQKEQLQNKQTKEAERKRKADEFEATKPKRRQGQDPVKVQARMDKYVLELEQATKDTNTQEVQRLSRNIQLLKEQLTTPIAATTPTYEELMSKGVIKTKHD